MQQQGDAAYSRPTKVLTNFQLVQNTKERHPAAASLSWQCYVPSCTMSNTGHWLHWLPWPAPWPMLPGHGPSRYTQQSSATSSCAGQVPSEAHRHTQHAMQGHAPGQSVRPSHGRHSHTGLPACCPSCIYTMPGSRSSACSALAHARLLVYNWSPQRRAPATRLPACLPVGCTWEQRSPRTQRKRGDPHTTPPNSTLPTLRKMLRAHSCPTRLRALKLCGSLVLDRAHALAYNTHP